MSLNNQQIRSIAPIGNEMITLGAAVQTINWDFVLSENTNMIWFGLSEGVTTVPANDPLLPACYTSISITINGSFEIIRDFTRAEYLNAVQNLETKEADIISNGNMLIKMFKPALPKGTRIQISLVVNTLALATTTPAATAVFRAICNTYDAPSTDSLVKELTVYQRIPQFPQPVGVVAATPIQQDLGVEVKTVKYLVIIERAALVNTDTFTGLIELMANGNTVARINVTTAKKHYDLIADGLPVPVGYHMLKLPNLGWNASQATTLHLRIIPHTTAATGNYIGFQVLVKPYL